MHPLVWLVLLVACSVVHTRAQQLPAQSPRNAATLSATYPEPVLTRDVGTAASRARGQKPPQPKRRRSHEPFRPSFGPPQVNRKPFRPSDVDPLAVGHAAAPANYGPPSPGDVEVVPWSPDASHGHQYVPEPAWYLRPQFNVYKGDGHPRRIQRLPFGGPHRGRSARRRGAKEHEFHSVVNYGVVNIHHANHYEPHHNGDIPTQPPPTTQEPLLIGLGNGSGQIQPGVHETPVDEEGSSLININGETETDAEFSGNIEENVQTTTDQSGKYPVQDPDESADDYDDARREMSSTTEKVTTDSHTESTPTTDSPEEKHMNEIPKVVNEDIATNLTQLSANRKQDPGNEEFTDDDFYDNDE